MIWKASLVLSLVIGVLSQKNSAFSEQQIELFSGHHGHLSHIGQHEPEQHEIYAWAYPSYEFSYHVEDPHTHDRKGQHEIRDGDKVTGNYWLVQPDGRKRTVKYSSDHKNGFNADVYYEPHDGHHYEVKERHEEDPHLDHGWRYFGKRRDDKWNVHHDDRWRVGIDDKRDNDHNRRRDDGYDEKRDHVNRWDHDDKRGHDNKRRHDDENDRDNHLRAWMKARRQHKDHDREDHENDMGDRKLRIGHEEHWKHGRLVGWTEGRDRDYHHRERDDHRDQRNNNKRIDEYRRSNDNYEDHGDQHSYNAPKINFKPLVPYGQRLE